MDERAESHARGSRLVSWKLDDLYWRFFKD